MPGIHTCLNKSLQIEHSLRESRLIIPFNSTYFIPHCSMWLTNLQIDSWNSLLETPDIPFYRFYVNESYRVVPLSNGTHFFTHFTIVIDKEFGRREPKFNVIPQNLMRFAGEENPLKHPGFYVNFSFSEVIEDVSEGGESVRVELIPITWVLFSLLLFLPAVWLFWINHTKFLSVPQFTDIHAQPTFYQNLAFFTASGQTEVLRLWALTLLADRARITYTTFLNYGLLAAILPSLFRVWVARKSGELMFHADFSGFIHISSCFTNAPLIFAVIVSSHIFGALRGLPLFHYLVLVPGYVTASYVTARSPGLAFLAAFPQSRRPWFVKKKERQWTLPSPTEFAFGAVGTLILRPLISHALAWLYGEVVLDIGRIAFWVTAYSAWDAFGGMLRTVRRLNNGKGLWQDDHIFVHAIPALLLPAEVVWTAFWVRGLHIADFAGVAFCGLTAGAFGAMALVFGTMASFGVSFVFVYVALMRNHVGEVDG
jgi:hypothetical protein